MVEADIEGDLEFKWGKKKSVGGKDKKVHFYQSFIYDGVEYVLYDCVYLFEDRVPVPHIGKLIKIWETPNKKKTVKVLWFFRPHEIQVEAAAENELFLASGEGVGLANINPLEAIAGKCNVVCTSKDSRNPQPSDEDLQKADFIFYRAFDVGLLKIVDNIEGNVAGIAVEFLFNRVDIQKPSVARKLDSDNKEVGGNAVASNKIEVPSSKQNLSKERTILKIDGTAVDTVGKENAGSKTSLGEEKYSLRKLPDPISGVEVEAMAKSNDRRENITFDKTKSGSKTTENTDSKGSLVKQKSLLRERSTSSIGVKSEISKPNNRQEIFPGDEIALRSEDDFVVVERLVDDIPVRHGKVGKNLVRIEDKVKSAQVCSELADELSKKAKFDGSVKVSDYKNEKSVRKFVDMDCKDTKALATVIASEDKYRFKRTKDSEEADKGPSKKLKPDEETKLSSGGLPQASPRQPPDQDKNVDHQKLEVTRRPDVDRSRWFRALPWEDRMKEAYEQGTLVLLQNLDPTYNSAEVEDIVWHGFKETCTAKMIQRTSTSSPHSDSSIMTWSFDGAIGQAFVIFKAREVAEMVVEKLSKGCLLLLNGSFVTLAWLLSVFSRLWADGAQSEYANSLATLYLLPLKYAENPRSGIGPSNIPLLGSAGTPCFPEKKPSFFGHFGVDKLRYQMPREMREAVSTAHCSQPNTIEYELAMEWRLLQERSDLSWKKFALGFVRGFYTEAQTMDFAFMPSRYNRSHRLREFPPSATVYR
ncbi:hypothetical protein CJ030_MR7G022679 [Morella rubra]|uniref:BAH domain-containing protein n=1 Tax=Morella rubra TaxID=262757 RepID=A0A6A1V6S9_9ROSI|nr:hypothetical protein CJ030_MR7G022679 [Morella rubra]